MSDYGRRLLMDELGREAALDHLMPFLEHKYGDGVRAGRYDLVSNRDLGKVALGLDEQSRYGTQSLGLARMQALLQSTARGLTDDTGNRERLQAYHPPGMALIFAGIYLTTVRRLPWHGRT